MLFKNDKNKGKIDRLVLYIKKIANKEIKRDSIHKAICLGQTNFGAIVCVRERLLENLDIQFGQGLQYC